MHRKFYSKIRFDVCTQRYSFPIKCLIVEFYDWLRCGFQSNHVSANHHACGTQNKKQFKSAGDDLSTISRQGRDVLNALPNKTPENHL